VVVALPVMEGPEDKMEVLVVAVVVQL